MICYMDRTFCDNPDCDCSFPKWNEELAAKAERWWNPKDIPDKRGAAPVCFVVHEGCASNICMDDEGRR